MEWIVNIEGSKNQRVKIKFYPKSEEVFFIGQYKPHNKEWIDFSEETYSMEIDLPVIQELLAKTVKTMRERLKAYENIAEGFQVIKLIEVKEVE
jgi:hypothetical protein